MNPTRFFEQIITEIKPLDLKDEDYILGDFNINLFFKRKCILISQKRLRNYT